MRLIRTSPAKPSEPLVVYSMMGAALLLAARFYPFDRFPLVTCPLRAWAHIPCPTCGMTRAFVRMTHGQWYAAFRVSPLGAGLSLVVAGAVLYTALRLTVLRRGVELRLARGESIAARVAVVAAVVGNWVYLLVSGAAS